jgi:microcystin-dependent protein
VGCKWKDATGGIHYSDGNVGIGTTSPGKKLDVNGVVRANNAFVLPTTGPGGNEISTYGDAVNDNTSFDNLRIDANHHLALIIDEQSSGVGDLIVAKDSPWSPVLFTVKNNGNVGIGTTEPSEKLEVAGTVKATKFVGDGSGLTGISGIPSGVIVMWSGSIASIPSGWALCDGTNGTPDLRDRFIVGAGSSYNPGDTGGENVHTLTIDEMPRHRHTVTTTGYSWTGSGYITVGDNPWPEFGATNYEGGGQPHENRPPYYALAYIMKL